MHAAMTRRSVIEEWQHLVGMARVVRLALQRTRTEVNTMHRGRPTAPPAEAWLVGEAMFRTQKRVNTTRACCYGVVSYWNTMEHWLSDDPAWRLRDDLTAFAQYLLHRYRRPVRRIEMLPHREVVHRETELSEEMDAWDSIDWEEAFPFGTVRDGDLDEE